MGRRRAVGLALGFIAGLAEFVPLIGPIFAAIPALLIAGAQDWQTVLLALAVLVVVQQVESTLISPLIADRMASIAPAVGLFAVVAMGVLFGPLGLIWAFLSRSCSLWRSGSSVRDTLGERIEIIGHRQRPPSDTLLQGYAQAERRFSLLLWTGKNCPDPTGAPSV